MGKKADNRVALAKQEIAEILRLVAQGDERYTLPPGYIRFGRVEKDLCEVVERLAEPEK